MTPTVLDRPEHHGTSGQEPTEEKHDQDEQQTMGNSTADEESAGSETKYPSVLVRSIIVSSLMLATFLIALDMSIVGTAVPIITTEFKSMTDVGWYGSSFFLTLAAFISAWGKAYKYFSLRIVYVMAVFLFEVGSLLCALAPNSVSLICGRAIQGLGGAGISGGGYIITAFVCPPHVQPVVIGLMGSVFTVASVAGPLLGGVFSSHLTWRWCFYINLPIGAVTMFCILFIFKTPKAAKTSYGTPMMEIFMSFDPIGSVLVFAAVLSFFLAIQWGGVVYPWNSSIEIGLLVGCALLSVTFAFNEWFQGDRALIVYRHLRRRSIGASAGFILFLNAGNIALQYQLPIYFQVIQGDSPVQSGIKMIPSILATAIATAVGSGLAGHFKMFQPFLLSAGIIAMIGCGLIFTFDLTPSLGAIIGYQVLYGVGCGLGVQVPNLVATITSAPEDVSTTVSSVAFFMMLAGGWGVAATDAMLNNVLLRRIPHYVSGLNGHEVLQVGASGLEEVYSGQVLRGVREAYLEGLHAGWALGIAAFGMAFVCALLPKWPGRLSKG